MNIIQVIGIEGLPVIKRGDNLAELICQAAEKQGTPIQDGDIIVVSHIAVSRAEGSIINLNEVRPSTFAVQLAKELNKDPRLVEVVLREAKSIIRKKLKRIARLQSKRNCLNGHLVMIC